MEEMTDSERLAKQAEKAKLKAMYRGGEDDTEYYPIIIKAG